MHWFILALKRSMEFSGRSVRREYWCSQITGTLIFVAVVVYEKAMGNLESNGIPWLAMVLFVTMLLPNLSLSVRRLHDTDRRGWWALISAIPFIGIVIFWILAALPSTPHENRFGAPHQGA